MSEQSDVRVEDDGPVRRITLNRPNQLNAMSTSLFDTLRDSLIEASIDDRVRCVVLTGSGRGFSAGLDIDEMLTPKAATDGRRHGYVPCIEEVERFTKPLLAAVNGVAVGFGATMLLHCDLVLASSEARFRFPFADLGLAPEASSSATLPLAVGYQEAFHLLTSSDWIDAQRAVEIGLVWRSVPPEELLPTAMKVAQSIAEKPLSSLIATKKLLLAPRLEFFRAARDRELDAYARLLGAPANRDAVAAFRRRRSSGGDDA